MTTHAYKIAVIPGDGIGTEVVPEAIRVLEAAGRKFEFACTFDEKDWSCERFAKQGAMMPGDGLDEIKDHDAILLGAVGFPGVPDHVSLWGLLIPIRREFRQYVALRPVRLFEGMACPLAGREPGDIDFLIVRENNEGDYSEIGSLIAPRPAVWEVGSQDGLITPSWAALFRRRLERAYKAYGALAKLRFDHYDGGHRWNGQIAYPLFDQVLKA